MLTPAALLAMRSKYTPLLALIPTKLVVNTDGGVCAVRALADRTSASGRRRRMSLAGVEGETNLSRVIGGQAAAGVGTTLDDSLTAEGSARAKNITGRSLASMGRMRPGSGTAGRKCPRFRGAVVGS